MNFRYFNISIFIFIIVGILLSSCEQDSREDKTPVIIKHSDSLQFLTIPKIKLKNSVKEFSFFVTDYIKGVFDSSELKWLDYTGEFSKITVSNNLIATVSILNSSNSVVDTLLFMFAYKNNIYSQLVILEYHKTRIKSETPKRFRKKKRIKVIPEAPKKPIPALSLKSIPVQIIKEGEKFNAINLFDFLDDSLESFTEKKWSFKGNNLTKIKIDHEGIIKAEPPNEFWNGQDSVIIFVSDSLGRADSVLIRFLVMSINQRPKIKPIKDQLVRDFADLKKVALKNYISDIDHSFEELKITLDNKCGLMPILYQDSIWFSPLSDDWFGTDTVKVIAADPLGYKDSTIFYLTILEKQFWEKQPARDIALIAVTGVDDVVQIIKSPVRWENNDWLKFGAVIGGTALLMTIDSEVREIALRNKSLANNPALKFGEIWGRGRASEFTALGLTILGLLNENRKTVQIGLEVFESFWISHLTTELLKYSFGRARPHTDKGPYNYQLINGIEESRKSLPSGHVTHAFSFSSVLAFHVDEWYWKTLIFAPAFLTVAQRIISDSHWISDTFLGAAIGYFTGTFLVNRHKNILGEKINLSVDHLGRLQIVYLLN